MMIAYCPALPRTHLKIFSDTPCRILEVQLPDTTIDTLCAGVPATPLEKEID